MDRDFIHCRGGTTLVEVWIEGKLRDISVSRAAIETWAEWAGGGAAPISDLACREFVRANLRRVVAAATIWLQETNPQAESVSLGAGQL